ncbi:MAG: signal recognition particle-docking protein FtsY, partial [Pirellula sp.]
MFFWRKKKSETAEASPALASPALASPASAPSSSVGPESNSDPELPRTDASTTNTQSVSWYRRALAKTNEWLRTDIRDLWKNEGQLVDETFLSELYATLVRTDMGGPTATKIRDSIASTYRARRIELEDVLSVIRNQVKESLQSKAATLNRSTSGPTVILVVGVNGSGKTTSIAKLAHRLTRQGNRVLLGAGDTFRAAAVEQLKVWSQRIGCDIVLGEHGSDPGSVVYRTVQRAVAESYDVCILDTAGRLQTQSNLMQQLEKIKRVIEKQISGAPHEVLLVLDATAGQNAISQAKGFSDAAGCTGIVLAKMDGSAKGGVIVPIAEQFGLPVKFIGIGEKLDDLSEFDPNDFAA